MFKSKVLLVLALGGGLIVSSALAQQQEVDTHQEFWNQAITNLEDHADTILEQLESARKDHPELAATFEALAGYIRFIAKQNRIAADNLKKYDLGPIPGWELPVLDVCLWMPDSTLCRCAGDLRRCIFPPGEWFLEIPDFDLFVTAPTCDELRVSLQEAIQCKVAAAMAGDVPKIAECQADIDKYSADLVASGCLVTCTGIATQVAEKRARLNQIFNNGGPITPDELAEVLQLANEIADLLAEANAIGCP